MKILLNGTTATKGGALHLSTTLIREALQDDAGHEWCFAVSDVAKQEFDRLLPGNSASFEIFDRSPSRSRRSRRKLARLEARLRPDCVFTPYGPAYVRFTAPHLLGVAVPWVTHPSLIAYRTLDFPHEWVKRFLSVRHKRYWFRQADAWWVETDCARDGLVRRLGLPAERIEVVPNTCGVQYRQRESRRRFSDRNRELQLLYFTAPYKHKNLNMVPRVAKALRDCDPELRFRMVTTLPPGDTICRRMMRRARSMDVLHLIDNRGPIRVADGPSLYAECDICFMPTVLEVFSATYPEAMAMGLPILTSDLDFARDICGKAALYFQANQPTSAAQAVLRLVRDPDLWDSLVQAGRRVLQRLPTPAEKYRIYMDLLSHLVEGTPIARSSASEIRRCDSTV